MGDAMRFRPLIALSALVILFCLSAVSLAASANGSAGEMPAVYDGQPLVINFKEQPANAEESLIAHNRSINVIYTSEELLPGEQPFVAVIDAIQGDGFNPLWQEVEIHFISEPRQFLSDDEILQAASAGEISLDVTDEVYRCSVVNKNP